MLNEHKQDSSCIICAIRNSKTLGIHLKWDGYSNNLWFASKRGLKFGYFTL